MSRMKYTCSITAVAIDELIDIARNAEEVGFDSIALSDSLFYPEKQAVAYPYTPHGSRWWNENTATVSPIA